MKQETTMLFRTVVTSAAVLGLLACSGSTTTTMSSSDVQAFQKATADVRGVVDEHRTLAAAIVLPSACNDEQARYDGKVRPLVKRMMDLSGVMDGCMRGMGHDGQADMGAMCQSMQGELDRHAGAACVGDSIQFRSEAERDCLAMLDWTARADQRSRSMQDMMGGSGMMSGGECRP